MNTILLKLARFLEPASVAVVAGFQGITADGDLTTLGRGGSDLTAVILARELGQKVCEKFTDEDGIYTADPRLISHARKVWHLDYEEMLSLAKFGNGILHPRAISSARDSNIRIHVRSSFSQAEGSIVGPDGDDSIPVKSITCDNKFVCARIHGISKPDEIFSSSLAQLSVKPSLMQWKSYNQHQGSFRIGFNRSDSFEFMPFCWEQASRLKAEEVDCFANLTTVSLVGCGLKSNPDIVSRFHENLKHISPVLEQHDGLRLSFSVEKDQVKNLLEMLHQTLLKQL